MHTTPSQQQSPMYALPRKRRRWPWILLAVVGALVALIVLAIVTADEKPVAAGSSQGPSSAAPSVASGIPSPDAGQRADYLATLAGIDPGLVVNEDRAIYRGRNVCDRILHPPKGSTWTVTKYTVFELSGGNATIDAAQARQVIRAVKVWCSPA